MFRALLRQRSCLATLAPLCSRLAVTEAPFSQDSTAFWAPQLLQAEGWAAVQRASFAKASKKKKDAPSASNAASNGNYDTSEASSEMSRAVEYLEQELASVRTGRASAGLLDNLKVQVYGQRMPLRGAANVSVRDAQTLLVTAFDPSTVPAIEKAITSSSLNLNPRTDGQELVVPVPRPTKDTLSAMGKLIGQAGEAAKVKVRQARKNAVDGIKSIPSEDEQKRAEKHEATANNHPNSKRAKQEIAAEFLVQNMTNQFVASIDKVCSAKEKELQVL